MKRRMSYSFSPAYWDADTPTGNYRMEVTVEEQDCFGDWRVIHDDMLKSLPICSLGHKVRNFAKHAKCEIDEAELLKKWDQCIRHYNQHCDLFKNAFVTESKKYLHTYFSAGVRGRDYLKLYDGTTPPKGMLLDESDKAWRLDLPVIGPTWIAKSCVYTIMVEGQPISCLKKFVANQWNFKSL